MSQYGRVKTASFFISHNFLAGDKADVGLVLGSAQGDFVNELKDTRSVPYSQIPGFPDPKGKIPGHAGELWTGKVGERRVIALRGRHHYYQGYSLEDVVLPVRAFIESGVRTLIITNAAGGLNPRLHKPGDFVAQRGHLNIPQLSPLMGDNEEELGIRFPPMNNAYDHELRALAQQQAESLRISFHASGVYAWMVGPAYETPEEIEMVRRLGADLVGMSTVPEVIAVRHMATKRPGIRILAISCITNMGAGLVPNAPSHEEVTETGARVKVDFARLMTAIIENLPT